MGKGRKAQPVQPGPPSKPLPAQGTGQQKRTPNSAFDAAAGNDIYEPEMVVGERQKNLGGGKDHNRRRPLACDCGHTHTRTHGRACTCANPCANPANLWPRRQTGGAWR